MRKGAEKNGYAAAIAELKEQFPVGMPILGETSKKEFIRLFGVILRLKNTLSAFDEFMGNEILTDREFQDYQRYVP